MTTLEQCEIMTLKLGRVGGFVEMSYRLFPETRNSFTPDFLSLGFDFKEIRQITLNAELRFQIFPPDVIAPLKKRLEEVRAWLHKHDEGPFFYTGDAFLRHDNVERFEALAQATRDDIRATLREQVVDNYSALRQRAHEELVATFETLLPRLGIANTAEILSDPSWFDQVFPEQNTLSADLRLDVHIYNVHPKVLMSDARLRRQLETFLGSPRQLTLFGSGPKSSSPAT